MSVEIRRVTQVCTESQVRPAPQPLLVEPPAAAPESYLEPPAAAPESYLLRETAIAYLRLLWERRRLLSRASLIGLLLGTLTAFLLPRRFESRTQLMPPDNRPGAGMAMAALAGRTGSLAGVAGDVLG